MGFFKKFGKKDSKPENENKNRGTDSNALSEDELSNVSGGSGTCVYNSSAVRDALDEYNRRRRGEYTVNDKNLPYTDESDKYKHDFNKCPSDFQFWTQNF